MAMIDDDERMVSRMAVSKKMPSDDTTTMTRT